MSYLGYIPRTTRTSTNVPVTAGLVATSTINVNYRVGYIDVFRNGIKLFPGPDYSAINGTQIVLADAPAMGDDIEVVSYQSLDFNNAYGITGGTGSGGTNTSSTKFSRIETAFNIASTTSTLAVVYATTDYIDVFKNGVKLSDGLSGTPADFVAGGSNTISFSVPLIAGDIVEIIRFETTGAGAGFTRAEFAEVVSAPTTSISFASAVGDFIDVYRNGIKLSDGMGSTPADYTITPSAINFAFTLNAGDIIQIIDVVAASTANDVISSSTRILLSTDLTIYVSPTGSDTNLGLLLSPFLTLQGAWNYAQKTFDLNGHTLTIQVEGAATPHVYSPLIASNLITGQVGSVIIACDPTFVLGASTSISASNGALISVENLIISNSTGSGLEANNASIIIGTGIEFGTCLFAHILAKHFGIISSISAYSIIDTAQAHWYASNQGLIDISSAITLSGTLSFTLGFAYADVISTITAIGNIFTDTATFTGTSLYYSSNSNSVINTNGASATFFPGNSSAISTTGLYI